MFFTQMTKNLQAETQALLAALRFAEQLDQLIFPQRRNRVAAVAARFVTHGNHNRAAVWDALYFGLQDSEFWWIDQIVRRIDGQKWRLDFFQIRPRIVIV